MGGIPEPVCKTRLGSKLVAGHRSQPSSTCQVPESQDESSPVTAEWYQDWASYTPFSLALFTNQIQMFKCRVKKSSSEKGAGF